MQKLLIHRTQTETLPDHVATGAKLRAAREARGIMQSFVAEKMGIHSSRLNRMEKGHAPWTEELARAFMVAIGS